MPSQRFGTRLHKQIRVCDLLATGLRTRRNTPTLEPRGVDVARKEEMRYLLPRTLRAFGHQAPNGACLEGGLPACSVRDVARDDGAVRAAADDSVEIDPTGLGETAGLRG